MATQRRARKRARCHISKSLCSECQSDTTPHDDDAEGLLLKCAKCKYAVHRSCSGFHEKTWKKLQEGIHHCLECKRCSGCDAGKCGDTDTVLCIECDRMFHYDCHMPNVNDAPNGWTCSKCRPSSATPFVRPASPALLEPNERTSLPPPSRALPVIKISNEGGRTTVLKYYPENENRAKTDLDTSSVYNRIVKADNTGLNTTPSSGTSNIPPYPLDAFLSHMTKTFPTFAGHTKSIDPELGDLKDLTVYQILSKKTDSGSHLDNSKTTAKNVNKIETWSSELIAESLKKKGHEEFADVIRKHMIDGQSLLHLVRDDVVNRFGLSLGPAVKMWRELCDFESWLD
ncbi:hypothetical protein RvY_09901-2 [Ramazzottius varieornatus]|uniref:PHD-type domain-containing protein n=1 Tax=Ramazzottius varieornatus TaxID=947166 RepID=A0A1D1VJY1_RAMVA|nr:hypothetical protein RvY_09901-2 [Ramazzottius varieornatus]